MSTTTRDWSEERRFVSEEEANEYVERVEKIESIIIHPRNGLLVNYDPTGGSKPWVVVIEFVL